MIIFFKTSHGIENHLNDLGITKRYRKTTVLSGFP